MGDPEKNIGQESLIDVEDFEEEELTELEADDEVTPIRERADLPSSDRPAGPKISPEEPKRAIYIATMRERFAAFFIDTLFLFYFYWIYLAVYGRVLLGTWTPKIPITGWHAGILHGSFLALCFLYYFACESVALTTVGKFSCWMSVRSKSGQPPRFISTFFRNLFRPVDYILIIPVVFIMEKSRLRQRLGDMLAGTTVVKKYTSEPGTHNISPENIASATGRTFAIIVDIIFFLPFIVGYILMLNSKTPYISQWILLLMPLVIIVYFVLIEMAGETSPGKWLMGYVICQDDGRRLSMSGALIRTLWLIFDANPIGLICIFLSTRHVRPGDAAGGTVVIRSKRKMKGLISIAIAFLLAGATIYPGLTNENSPLSKGFDLNFLPRLPYIEKLKTRWEEEGKLEIMNLHFAANRPEEIRTPPVFSRGEVVYIVFDVKGFKKRGRQVWVQENMKVIYPDGSTGLSKIDVESGQQVLDRPDKKYLLYKTPVLLPSDANPGEYKVIVTIRDKFKDEEATQATSFYVRQSTIPSQPTEPEPQPQPLPQPAPKENQE